MMAQLEFISVDESKGARHSVEAHNGLGKVLVAKKFTGTERHLNQRVSVELCHLGSLGVRRNKKATVRHLTASIDNFLRVETAAIFSENGLKDGLCRVFV